MKEIYSPACVPVMGEDQHTAPQMKNRVMLYPKNAIKPHHGYYYQPQNAFGAMFLLFNPRGRKVLCRLP